MVPDFEVCSLLTIPVADATGSPCNKTALHCTMPIQVTCPHCSKTISAADRFAGRTASCPSCRKPIEIPAAEAEIEVPDFGAPQSIDVGGAKIDIAPAAPPASPYTSPRTATSGDRGELQRVKIVGIRLPFMDVLILMLQSFAVGVVLSFIIWIALFLFAVMLGLGMYGITP
jgi:hypothetical protein